MAHSFYLSVKGTKQGQFKGEGVVAARKDKWQEGLSYFHEIKSPRDIATGQASGKRQHGAITITKEWGASTPQYFTALCTNEVLPEVNFEFLRTNANGEEYVYTKIKLTNATVSNVKYSTGGAGTEGGSSSRHTSANDTLELETLSFTYQKFEFENVDGKTMGMDDWTLGK